MWIFDSEKKVEYKLISKENLDDQIKCVLKSNQQKIELTLNPNEKLEFKIYEDYKKIHYYYEHSNFAKNNRDYVRNYLLTYDQVLAVDLVPHKDSIPITIDGSTIYFDVVGKSEKLYDGCIKLEVHRTGAATYGTDGREIYVKPDRSYSVKRHSYLFEKKQEEKIIDSIE
ncbi:hypothetical protein [Lysinibacillus sphaericus]|uniref:hypothetical protein n=1 Tax=Lysinibacillus sphaericus TaxID=1421 RepID=UPI000C1793D0|nr:hypothetical protein [Lysinibacillus sphaericus]